MDEVQHGIAIAESKDAMQFIKEKKIRFNITPTSNVLLGRVECIANHPIAKLYRYGIDVTVNSDDILIFDSDVTREYLWLFESGCLAVEELDDIRVNGLKYLL